jgi:hypothetical protein
LLKLFYDFVFRQVDHEGSPVIDWGHIVECFNKVDAGVPEKVWRSPRLAQHTTGMRITTNADHIMA